MRVPSTLMWGLHTWQDLQGQGRPWIRPLGRDAPSAPLLEAGSVLVPSVTLASATGPGAEAPAACLPGALLGSRQGHLLLGGSS